MKKRRFVSLFRKQLLVAGIFALLLTLGTSTYQFFSNLEQLQDQSDATLLQILMATAEPLEELLIDGKLADIEDHLEGLFSFAPVLRIDLLDVNKTSRIQLERLPMPEPPTWWQKLLFGEPHEHRFSLSDIEEEPSWTIVLTISNARIPAPHGQNLLAILLTNFIVCTVLTLAFYSLLHALFTRQLSQLTKQLENFRKHEGGPFKMEVSPFHENDEIGMLAETINELWHSRQELQSNLAEHNQFVTTVTAISPVGLFRTDIRGDLIWYNQKARVLLGILGYEKSLDEWLGNLHSSQQAEVLCAWEASIRNENPFHAEFQLCLADNKTRWVIGEAIPSWSGGHFEGFVGTLTDITQLKQATVKLHESEERYHAITQTANSAIVLTEANGSISYWNPAAEAIFGYTRKEALGENLAGLIIPEQARANFAEVCPEFEERNDDFRGQLVELEVLTKDGRLVPVEMSLSAFKMEESWHVALIISDISKRILSEREKVTLLDQLRQSQKMEAMGTLAGGIAHDFNNILTPILGFGQMLQMKLPEGSKDRDRVDKIMTSANRAKDLVGQILSFSRKSKEEVQPILVVPVIKEALKLLRAGIPATIEIKTRIPSTDFWILADPTRVHQILMNLATNAVQAMSGEGGTLSIQLDQRTLSAEDYPLLKAGPYLRLQITDTGVGIDQYTIERIFDPYFTTKGSEAGTGLGLAVVQSNITSLGGTIEVESELGKGSSFTVLIPLITGEFQRSDAHQRTLPHGGDQHLLLVDDEMSLVNIGREFLEDLGYQVTGTTNSREALEWVEQNPDRFDMLVTDQTMPQLTGLELTRQVHKLRPDLPVIICTGQRDLLNDEDLQKANILKVLGKPDLFNDLAACLTNYFNQPPVGSVPVAPEVAPTEEDDSTLWS